MRPFKDFKFFVQCFANQVVPLIMVIPRIVRSHQRRRKYFPCDALPAGSKSVGSGPRMVDIMAWLQVIFVWPTWSTFG